MTEPEQQSRPVLIIDLAKRYGGAEVRVLDTAKLLHGHYPYAVATLVGSPLHQRLQKAGLTALPLPFARSDPRLLLFLLDAIRRNGYKIVDAHNVQSQFWGHLAAMLTDASKVSTIHSAYKLEHNGSLKGRLYEQVLRLNNGLGSRFVAVSEAVYSYLQNTGIPPDRISLIHNSIDLPSSAARKQDHPLLESLGWDRGAFVVIVVARLEPVKGHTFLIEAVSRIRAHYPQLRVLLVGEGRTRAALETQLKQTNLQEYIHLAGFRDDIPALLNASDAFCLPSLSEGLPYALLEACAHRLPVLVTEVGGMAELLSHQHSGYLIPPANPEALAEGLSWLIDHPQEAAAMEQAAFDTIQRQFSQDEMINKTLDVYYENDNNPI